MPKNKAWHNIAKTVIALINIVVCIGLISSAWVGTLNPAHWPRLAILSMTFPFWAVCTVMMLVADFFLSRKWCIGIAVATAISLPMFFVVFPLNIERGDVPKRLNNDSWSLLTYNTVDFLDLTGKYPGGINPTIQYILGQNTDVVVLQETDFISAHAPFHITEAQIDTLRLRYPYIFIGTDVTLLSRFDAEEIKVKGMDRQGRAGQGRFGAWLLDIHNRKVLIVGVHLKSIGLTGEDKELYREITQGRGVTKRSDIREIKSELIGKLGAANAVRSEQTMRIVNLIDSLGVDDVVVCGDFNDTPGCYSLYLLGKTGLREVYPLVGNGYMATYNRNRFYFEIDHVLVRGHYRPWSLRCGDLNSSDHYPLTVTFVGEGR